MIIGEIVRVKMGTPIWNGVDTLSSDPSENTIGKKLTVIGKTSEGDVVVEYKNNENRLEVDCMAEHFLEYWNNKEVWNARSKKWVSDGNTVIKEGMRFSIEYKGDYGLNKINFKVYQTDQGVLKCFSEDSTNRWNDENLAGKTINDFLNVPGYLSRKDISKIIIH